MIHQELGGGTRLRAARLRLSELSLYVVEAGPVDGPAVILLHGFPEFWWGWRHQIDSIAQAGFRVIVPDQRGYASSDKPLRIASYRLARLGADVIDLADKLGVESFGLVGHDWGGIVAWWVAGRYPERVRRLAILNAPHPDTTGRVLRSDPYQLVRSWYVAAFQIPVLPERLLASENHALIAKAMVKSSRPGTFGEAQLAAYREAWRAPGALAGMLAWYRALMRYRTRPVGQIAPPTSLIWGRRDTALGFAFARESLALCESGILTSLEASHWVQHEEAERVNAALIAHLKDL